MIFTAFEERNNFLRRFPETQSFIWLQLTPGFRFYNQSVFLVEFHFKRNFLA